jgi:dipeptidyl aminopeptidase/acylaminoacyl peptidase
MANPARSTGYGQAFIQRAWGDWRERVIGDLLAAVNGVATRPDIDGERVAAMGHSFGAHICNWLAGIPEHFKAVVSASGLWAFDQFHATTDKSTMWEEEFGDPYLDVEPYIRNSPRVQLDAIRVPMLVIHGLRDYQVPVSEAIRLWTDIKRHDVPGKFLLLPDENHSLTLKPADVNLVYQTSLAFLDHHVLGQPWVRPEILG